MDLCLDAGNLITCLKDSVFRVSSIITTTGFTSTNFCQWPELSQALLVLMMCIGACAGSTSGGMKISRIMIYMKAMKKELEYQVHPRSIRRIKLDGKAVDDDVLRSTKVSLVMYFVLLIISALILCVDKYDLITNFTTVVAMMNNIGMGLGEVGPAGNFEGFSVLSKIVMIFDMLAWRLELVPMFLLLTPATCKKH